MDAPPSGRKAGGTATWRTVLLGILCSGIFLHFALRKVHLAESWAVLAQLRFSALLLPISASVTSLALRGWRWQQIFPPEARPSCWTSTQILVVSTAINNVVPGRGGDLARCLLVSERISLVGVSLALATLAVEKIVDGFALLAVVLLSCLVLGPPHWVWHLGVAAGVVLGGAALILLLLACRCTWLIGAVDGVLRRWRLARCARLIRQLLVGLAEGLGVLRFPRQIAVVGLLTVAIWIAEAALILGCARALHVTISPLHCVVVSAVLGLGLMIPAAPAAVGTYEFFAVSAMRLVAVPSASALAVTVLLHVWVLATTTAAGLMLGGSPLVMRRFRVSQRDRSELSAVPAGVSEK